MSQIANSKKKFVFLKKSSASGKKIKTYDVLQGTGDDGQTLRIQAESGTHYELFDPRTERGPEHVRAKRAGRDLEIFFEGSTQADIVIEQYYNEAIVEFPKDSLTGLLPKGDLAIYVIDEGLRPALTADFHHQHPVNIFMQPVLARIDTTQLELVVYFTGISYDDQTQLARSRVAQWVECKDWSDVQLAKRIEADGVDVLVDLAGHTSLNRMGVFAQRAAPVQVTFLGYPASTGVPNMDWIMVDPVVAPEGSEALYSEQVWRLPHTVFCFAPETDYPSPSFTPLHEQRPLTFGSFNNVPKLTQHTLALWARVLSAVPGSRLLLKAPSFKDEGAIRAFKSRFAAQGIAETRLEFRGPVGLTDMMAEYTDVDIALDPVPYNGGTTTLQAMWMGVPVVVKAGDHFVSRMGASFMTAAGLPDWVAQSDDEYVAIAKRMVIDRPALLALKAGLRERLMAQTAWDIDRYTRDWQAALRGMWQMFCKRSVDTPVKPEDNNGI